MVFNKSCCGGVAVGPVGCMPRVKIADCGVGIPLWEGTEKPDDDAAT